MATMMPETKVVLAELDRAAQETFAFFAGPGRATDARVDRWESRDILMHFIYFHDATAWGIESAAHGGPPWLVSADADTVNDVCRRLRAHESHDELLAALRQAHARLMRAARTAPDLDRPCFQRSSGERSTGRERLITIARHWRDHVRALQAAAATR